VLNTDAARFGIGNFVALLPQLLVLHVLTAGTSTFVLLVLLWNCVPIFASIAFYLAGARRAAWGWLIGVGLWGLWTALSTVAFHSSTGSLGFFWGPIWSFAVMGPIGAVIAVLHAKRRRANPKL